MENYIEQKSLELFSELLINQTDHSFIYDLRHTHDKGIVSKGHPVFLRSIVDCLTHNSDLLENSSLELDKFNCLNFLRQEFKYICLTNSFPSDIDKYSIEDFFNKKEIKQSSIYLNNLLFTSSENLFSSDIFSFIESDKYYLDLGMGLYLYFGNDNIEMPKVFSPQLNFLKRYLKFLEEILIKKGKGRIKDINLKLNSSFKEVHGFYFKAPNLNLNQFVYSKNSDVYNITTSITDDQLDVVLMELNEK